MKSEKALTKGEIILYQSEGGRAAVEMNLQHETVWLNLNQMAILFGRDKSVIARHLYNIFRTKELERNSVVANFATTAADKKVYQTGCYSCPCRELNKQR